MGLIWPRASPGWLRSYGWGGALQAQDAVRPRPGSGGTRMNRVKGCACLLPRAGVHTAPLSAPSAGGGGREHGRWAPRPRPWAAQPLRGPAPRPQRSPGVTRLWVCAHCPAQHLSSACQAQRCSGGEAGSSWAGTHRCEPSEPRGVAVPASVRCWDAGLVLPRSSSSRKGGR